MKTFDEVQNKILELEHDVQDIKLMMSADDDLLQSVENVGLSMRIARIQKAIDWLKWVIDE